MFINIEQTAQFSTVLRGGFFVCEKGGHSVFCNLLMIKWLLYRVCLTHVWKDGVDTAYFITA